MLMRDAEGRKKQARSYKQQGKATQHTQGSHFSPKNELPRVGFEPTTLPTLDRTLYQHVHIIPLYNNIISMCMFHEINVPRMRSQSHWFQHWDSAGHIVK